MRWQYLPQVDIDIEQAVFYLEDQRQGLGERLLDDLQRVYDGIDAFPKSYSEVIPEGWASPHLARDLAADLTRHDALKPGTVVGAYKVTSELGRGGMAVVYAAERIDGGFDQQVTLKVIKRGLDSEELLRRFLVERQILASLDHPNIARLLDGGITEDGRPFFAMELVDGLPIDQYSVGRKLSLADRLRLFIEAGLAYHHRALDSLQQTEPADPLELEKTLDAIANLQSRTDSPTHGCWPSEC